MEIISNGISVEDWVRIVGHSMLNGFSGFVLKHDKHEGRYRILITRDSRGHKTRGSLWLDEDQVVSCSITPDEDDLLILIDMALDMRDERWFKELTDKLPLANF